MFSLLSGTAVHVGVRFTAIEPFLLPYRVALGMKLPARAIAELRPILCPDPDWLVAAAAEQTARRPGPQSEMVVSRQAIRPKQVANSLP